MDAIDWPALVRGALSVFGLSLSLAAFSHVRWSAKREGVPLRKAYSWNTFLAPFYAGLALFAIGLGWGATRLWETLAWIVLAVLFVLQAVLAIQGLRCGRAKGDERDAAKIVEEERG